MPKRYTSKQVLKALRKLQTAIIPIHHEIAVGTLSSILRQANVTKQELEDNI